MSARESEESSAPNEKKTSKENSVTTNNASANETNGTDKSFLLSQGYHISDLKILGEGTYSKVKKAYSRTLHKDVAIKCVNRKNAPKDFIMRFFPRELEIIKQIEHKHICKFYDVIDTGNKVYIIMEHATKGDLLDYVQANRFIVEQEARKIFIQVVSALQYLHSKNILHRDLKCENILLTENMEPLLTDFGFSKRITNVHDLNQTYCGSSAYAPIEILKGIPYDGPPAEVWSLGCILYIITTGTMPFDDSDKMEQIKQMKKGPKFARSKQNLSSEILSLLSKMLNVDTKERILLEQINENEWCTLNLESNFLKPNMECQ